MKFARNAVLIFIFLLLAGPFLFPLIDPWSEINCRKQWINIESGRARLERYIWFVKVSSHDEETALSNALGASTAKDDAWRLVNTFGTWQGHSPHHGFHGALNQVNVFETIAKDREWSVEKKREVALAVTAHWRTDGHYHHVDKYLQKQYELSLANEPQEKR